MWNSWRAVTIRGTGAAHRLLSLFDDHFDAMQHKSLTFGVDIAKILFYKNKARLLGGKGS